MFGTFPVHINLPSTDLKRSLEFYEEKLGLQVLEIADTFPMMGAAGSGKIS
jgi:catechol 2,3-dioxygenase-like lactoylglutathione lyase family enzyme